MLFVGGILGIPLLKHALSSTILTYYSGGR